MFQIPTAVFFCHAFRSSSSSGSRECSQTRKRKHRSNEEPTGKDNRCGSKSPSALNCLRSGDCKYPSPSKSHSRSRSRSRERRKGNTRPQQSASTSRHKGELKSKPNRRQRSRSRSKERRKEEGSSKSPQKPSSFSVPSSKDVKQMQAKKKEDIVPHFLKEDKGAAVKKEAQSKDLSTKSHTTTPATHRERTLLKEIKKEKPPTFDMFEESAGAHPGKKEESGVCGLMAVKKEEGYQGFKTEACDMSIIRSEASSPESCPSVTLVSPLIQAGGLQDRLDQLQPALLASAAQPDPAELAMEQESQQASDSDDDFNVDVMLDNLQYEKPEDTGDRASEQQGNEGVFEGGTLSGSKSKNQVKRVTWNIQEPEGPQPEKSPSSKCWQIFISCIKNLAFAFVCF